VKRKTVLVIICLLFCLAGCVREDAQQQNSNPYFNAAVLQVQDHSVLVEPFPGEEERRSSDQIWFRLPENEQNSNLSVKEGALIRVVYSGEIMESYPAQLGRVFAVYPVDEQGNLVEETQSTEK
jgi:hypothetical protein